MQRKKIFKAMVPFQGSTQKVDVIEHEGSFWLVPLWHDSETEEWTEPAFLIPLDRLAHQRSTGGAEWDFVVNEPMPKEFWTDYIPTQLAQQYGLITNTGIRLPIGGGYH